MAEYRHVTHQFGPIYNKNSRVLILGSFPSVKSLAQNFYYGNPQNRFWRIIAACVDEDEDLTRASIAQKTKVLLNAHIALWDVIESCDIIGSSDSSIKNVEPVEIEHITHVASITSIVTNGGKAASLYKKFLLPRTHMQATPLPSTSPANASWSFDRLLSVWKPALCNAIQ